MLRFADVATPNREAQIYALVVGALVQQLRERHQLTQGQLAERIGVTQSAISRVERGQAQPDPFEMRALADAFGMTAAELTTLIDDSFAKAAEAGKQALPRKSTDEWWETALMVVGVIGAMGLAMFGVAAVLAEADKKAKKKPRAPVPKGGNATEEATRSAPKPRGASRQ